MVNALLVLWYLHLRFVSCLMTLPYRGVYGGRSTITLWYFYFSLLDVNHLDHLIYRWHVWESCTYRLKLGIQIMQACIFMIYAGIRGLWHWILSFIANRIYRVSLFTYHHYWPLIESWHWWREQSEDLWAYPDSGCNWFQVCFVSLMCPTSSSAISVATWFLCKIREWIITSIDC